MRTIPIRLATSDRGERTIQIKAHWAGQGIAIHKPVEIDIRTGEPKFRQIHAYWRLTHIPTGLSLGSAMGSLDRVRRVVCEWDAEFAALQPGRSMASDRIAAWGRVVEDLRSEPPRAHAKLPTSDH